MTFAHAAERTSESGGLRVAALSRVLMESYDINVNRAVLISPLPKSSLPPDDARYGEGMMTILPSQAAIAAVYGRSRGTWPGVLLPPRQSGSARAPFVFRIASLVRPPYHFTGV